jgi:hypothetical protein
LYLTEELVLVPSKLYLNFWHEDLQLYRLEGEVNLMADLEFKIN